jgi:hypothetical protein
VRHHLCAVEIASLNLGWNLSEAGTGIFSLRLHACRHPGPISLKSLGDTCDTLDKKYNLVSGTIKQANQFLDCSNIWAWTPICIPDGPYNAPACKSTYTSVAGDTCSSIETKYNLVDGTIKTANGFLTCTDIWVNTPICIPDGPYKQVACKTTYTP